MAVPGQPAVLDTNRAYDAIASTILMQTGEGLTKHGRGLTVEPALAESWKFSDDYTTITYHLRPDLQWSDGQPLTAHDFEYGWKRLLAPETAAEYAYFLFDVAGAEAYNAGEASADAVGVQAVDDRTLRVDLRRPAPYFPHITTFMVTYPVRRDVVERYGAAWNKVLVAPGEYGWMERVTPRGERVSWTDKFYFRYKDLYPLLAGLLGFLWGVFDFRIKPA